MGKWTLEYHDEVLRNKVKNLVQGAIKRMKTEKDGPSITYESVVEDLDEGDSFTASLVDVLVKELAERRTRPDSTDRRLISERTAKSLRMQAEARVYRSGHLRDRVRRGVPVPYHPRPYSSSRVILSDSDGDEDSGAILDYLGRMEGAHINTDLYDAYVGPTSYDLQGSLPRLADLPVDSPRPSDQAEPSWLMNSPPPRSPIGFAGPWTGLGGVGSSSLTRQTTIRRPHRSRTMDSSEFTSFTSRRRSAIRDSTTHVEGPRAQSHADAVGSLSPTENARVSETTSTSTDTVMSRPLLNAWMSRRMSSTPSLGSSGMEEPMSGPHTTHNPTSSQLWHSMTASSSTSTEPISIPPSNRRSSTSADLNDDRRQVVAPRLRRGGLRPPELLQATAAPHQSSSLAGTEEPTHVVPTEVMTATVSSTPADSGYPDHSTMMQTHRLPSHQRSISPAVDETF